jgi:hypothetical protein
MYEEVKEEKSGESRLGTGDAAPKALYARYRMRMEKQDVASELYLLARRNQFIKVRATRRSDEEKAAQPKLDVLLNAIAETLAR